MLYNGWKQFHTSNYYRKMNIMASRQVYVNDLVTLDDLAERFKMSVGQVSNYAIGRKGKGCRKFPQPVVGRGTRAVWLWSETKEWFDAVQPKQARAEKKIKDKYRNDRFHVAA